MPVGIRELKSHLSEYVSRAARGEEVIVTDRNRPVARLVAYSEASNVDLGIEEGWITVLTFDVRQARTARELGLTVIGA